MVAQRRPDDFIIWGIAMVIGCVFLYCLPKLILVIVIAGMVLGLSTMGSARAK